MAAIRYRSYLMAAFLKVFSVLNWLKPHIRAEFILASARGTYPSLRQMSHTLVQAPGYVINSGHTE